MIVENRDMAEQLRESNLKLVRLLNYVLNLMEDYPHIKYPELPDTYSEMTWRMAA